MGNEETNSLEEVSAHIMENPKDHLALLDSKGNSAAVDTALDNMPIKLNKKDQATLCLLIKFGTISINAEEYLAIAPKDKERTQPPGVWKC
jgi:hypothetical protein